MSEIAIGRLRGGLCVYWYDKNNKRVRHQLEARTRKEAEAEALKVYRQENMRTAPVEATIAQIWAAYVEHLGEKPTAKTMKYTGKSILPFFGVHSPHSINTQMAQEYANSRELQGKKQGTVWTELGHLQSALNFGKAEKMIIGDTPKVWRPAKPEQDMRILNAGEIRSLIDAATAPHTRLALILLFGTGARVGALLDLTWDRVDFELGTINLRIPGSITRKGRAIVPMNSATRSALAVAKQAALSDYVIEYAAGPVKSLRKGICSAVERAKLGQVTIHEFRHTAAVHMLGAGISLDKVSQVLGHSNTSVTFKTYARYLPNHMRDAVDILDFTSIRKAN